MKFIYFRKLKTAIFPNYITNAVARQDLVNWGMVLMILVSVTTFLIWIFGRGDASILTNNTSLAVIKFTGILGIVMLSFSFILATRWQILEDLFQSLEKVYKAHDLVGRIIITLGFVHFALVLYSVKDDFDVLLNYILPFRTVPATYSIVGFWLLVVLVILTVWIRMPYQIWLQIHKLMIIPFTLLVLHGYVIKSGDFYNIVELKAWLSFWIIWGYIAYFYKLLFYRYFAEKYDAIVQSVRTEKDHTEIILKTKRNLLFKPAEFVFISFYKTKENIGSEKHPFSISNFSTNGTIRIIAKHLGDFTEKLPKLKENDRALVYGPYGDFAHKYLISKKDMVWIAGGIGIAPFLSMAEHLEKFYSDCLCKINLFYSVKSQDEFIYIGALKNLEKRIPNFKLHLIATKSRGKFLDAEEIALAVGGIENLKKQNFFMCGPTVMMNALSNELISLGVKPRNIEAEEFDFG